MTIRLPIDLAKRIENKSRKLHLKRSDIVRLALHEFLETPEQEEHPYKKVSHLIGSVSSGLSDLGTHHRDHLLTRFKNRE